MLDLDAYDRGARLAPAYLVFSPAVMFVAALSLGTSEWWSKIGGVLVACGAPLLAVQWGRSGGRRKQPALFATWGGSPTVILLRFRTGGNAHAVTQRHAAVERATGMTMPTAEEEARDPARADAVYESGVTALRELTRDAKQFPLVLKENISYGFRRNLWGRKAYGIAVAALTSVISVGLLIAATLGHAVVDWEAEVFAAVFAATALLVWITTINREWVREAGDAYATRLLDSAIRVPPAHSP